MTDLSAFKDWLIIIAGNIFIVILVFRCIGAYAKRDWGDLVMNLSAAVVIAFLVYANDSAIALLKQLASAAFGG